MLLISTADFRNCLIVRYPSNGNQQILLIFHVFHTGFHLQPPGCHSPTYKVLAWRQSRAFDQQISVNDKCSSIALYFHTLANVRQKRNRLICCHSFARRTHAEGLEGLERALSRLKSTSPFRSLIVYCVVVGCMAVHQFNMYRIASHKQLLICWVKKDPLCITTSVGTLSKSRFLYRPNAICSFPNSYFTFCLLILLLFGFQHVLSYCCTVRPSQSVVRQKVYCLRDLCFGACEKLKMK